MIDHAPPKRFLVLLALVCVIFTLLWLRLVDVAGRRGAEFLRLAQSNRHFTRTYPAERGVFLDRYDQPLVYNQKVYRLLANPERLYSDSQVIDHDLALTYLATDSASVSYEFHRHYPQAAATATALGYVSLITAEDLLSNRALALNSRLGRTGLEAVFERSLWSQAGQARFEVDAWGRMRRLVSSIAPVYGQNIATTLDPELSQLAYQALAGKKGAVVILDAKNSEVLTLISSPSFDPNIFNDGQTNLQQIRNYLQDPKQVFFNRAVNGAYPPGSIFKMITALGALEEAVIDARSVVEDEGVLKVGDFAYANWYYTQYGRVEGAVDVVKAIARSNDIFFYKAAEWLGPTKLAQYARLFGLGERTGVEAPSEGRGLVPDPAWKEQQRGEPWYLGNTYHFGIGQGDLLVTPLQMAVMMQALANEGVWCRPTLLQDQASQCRGLSLERANLDLIMEGMVAACSSGGTAYPLFDYNARYEKMLACKTGTAEFGAADHRGYRATHAWFTAIVNLPTEWRPELPRQLVIAVLVESDEEKKYREGSQDAAPVLAEMLEGLGL